MSQLDRRRVLTSLAGGAAVAAVAPGVNKVALAESECVMLPNHSGWLIAQRDGEQCGQHAIKFWSMDWAPTHFAEHLPPQISRGLIAYHDFGARIGGAHTAVDPLDRVFENCARKWIEPKQLDRFTLKLGVGPENFLRQLASYVGESGTPYRIALVDLDSRTCFGGETTRWRYILPAFAHCYDFVIGFCHFEQRGLRQERAYLDRIPDDDRFTINVLEPASLCDAVIVTSAGLIETDTGLCSRASTEALVGELVRRLGYALLERKILDRIVEPRETKTKSLLFALSSATVNAPSPLSCLQSILYRQSVFVSGSFAPLAVDEPPLFIATSRDEDLRERKGLMDLLRGAALISGYKIHADRTDLFATVQAPCYEADTRYSPGWFDLIALWPFKVDG